MLSSGEKLIVLTKGATKHITRCLLSSSYPEGDMSSPPIIVYNALKMLHAYCCPSFDMVTVAFGYLMK